MNQDLSSVPTAQLLIVYGSLAPGRENHHIVANIKGTWYPATVRGKLVQLGWGAAIGYSAFVPVSPSEANGIQAWVLHAEDLPAHWHRLDEFEGEQYVRIAVPFTLSNGSSGIGFLYALSTQPPT
ncbi:MAG: gamma-glutamylcyclotransferase [Cyclobacteriaceae bacterium]|nr:gamma-glutamylcyclotransferase [Cyclobacteriaceae bacterium]